MRLGSNSYSKNNPSSTITTSATSNNNNNSFVYHDEPECKININNI
jgi:hypothetical protein